MLFFGPKEFVFTHSDSEDGASGEASAQIRMYGTDNM